MIIIEVKGKLMDDKSMIEQDNHVKSRTRTVTITIGIVIVLLVIAVIAVIVVASSGPQMDTIYSNIITSL